MLDLFFAKKGGTYTFKDGDYFAERVRQDPFFADLLAEIAELVYEGKTSDKTSKDLGDLKNAFRASYTDTVNVNEYLQGRTSPTMELTMLGSYRVYWEATDVSMFGAAQVTITIKNKTTWESATRPPVVGYLPGFDSWGRGGLADECMSKTTPVQRQVIVLTANIPRAPRPPSPPAICRNAISGDGSC